MATQVAKRFAQRAFYRQHVVRACRRALITALVSLSAAAGFASAQGVAEPTTESVEQKAQKSPPKKETVPETPKSESFEYKDFDIKPLSPDKPATQMSLEELLAEALKSNPDILVADAKVREAEAQLNRTRLDVSHRVVVLRNSLEHQQRLIKEEDAQLARFEKLVEKGANAQGEVIDSRQKVIDRKAKLAELEAEVIAMLGRSPQGVSATAEPFVEMKVYRLKNASAQDIIRVVKEVLKMPNPEGSVITADDRTNSVFIHGSPRLQNAAEALIRKLDETAPERTALPKTTKASWPVSPVSPEVTAKLRKALDTPVVVKFQNMNLTEVLKGFQEKFDIRFVGAENVSGALTLDLGEVPLGVALEAIHDVGHVTFDVREYGVLVGMVGQSFGPVGVTFGPGPLIQNWKAERRADEQKTVPTPMPYRQPGVPTKK